DALAQWTEIAEPLRSAPLQQHLNWDGLLFMAEAGVRESLEVQLHDSTDLFRKLLLDSQSKVWASASIPDLRIQVNLSRWPNGEMVLRQAIAPASLSDVGDVLGMLQSLYFTFEQDFADAKTSLKLLQKELESQLHQFAVNLGIVLRQAKVLLGLLRGLPGFSDCLFQALAEARERRPSSSMYAEAWLFLQRMASGQHAATSLRVRAATFAGESFDKRGALGTKLRSLLESTRTQIKLVQASDLSKAESLHWCAGTEKMWEVDGSNPCDVLVKSLDEVSDLVIQWLRSGAPQRVLRVLRRRQFAAAPNISRVEVLCDVLHRTTEICTGQRLDSTHNLMATLQTVADEDEASFQEESTLLSETAESQFGHDVDANLELTRAWTWSKRSSHSAYGKIA
ncbi:unnamed protein product, partial [Effrenium voratum]